MWCWLRARLRPRADCAPADPAARDRAHRRVSRGRHHRAQAREPGAADLSRRSWSRSSSRATAPTTARPRWRARRGAALWRARCRCCRCPSGAASRRRSTRPWRGTGEVLVLTDARQPLSHNAIEALVEDLGDPERRRRRRRAGARRRRAGGRLLEVRGAHPQVGGAAGSTVGVSGALYAMRRELWRADARRDHPRRRAAADAGAAARASASVFEPRGQGVRHAPPNRSASFSARCGRCRGISSCWCCSRGSLSPLANPSWFDFVSHKLCGWWCRTRWWRRSSRRRCCRDRCRWRWSAAQLGGYGLAVRALARACRLPLGGLAETFVVLNAAAVVGLWRFVRYGRQLPW